VYFLLQKNGKNSVNVLPVVRDQARLLQVGEEQMDRMIRLPLLAVSVLALPVAAQGAMTESIGALHSAAIPEPATVLLLFGGSLVFILMRKK